MLQLEQPAGVIGGESHQFRGRMQVELAANVLSVIAHLAALNPSTAATSLVVFPCPTKRSTSFSRGDSLFNGRM